MRVLQLQLPSTATTLYGRETELTWLRESWRDRVHVVSIAAWGGVGKTALVNRWLAEMRDGEWPGVEAVFTWSFYSQGTQQVGSSDPFFSAALRAFGGETGPLAPWDKGTRLAELVRGQRAILVLDGMERLQGGPGVNEGKLKDPAVEALLRGLAGQNAGMCVVTTRIEVADLAGLGGAKVQQRKLEHLSTAAGAEMLQARGVLGTEEELREAAEEYKGHGLALTLLSSYLGDVAEGDVRRRQEIGPLVKDERVGGHARRVMAAYEPWLEKPERSILLMMGLFDRPAEMGEIRALRKDPVVFGLTDGLKGVGTAPWNKAVARLRRIGLLADKQGQDERLDAHPLVREHFGEQLKEARAKAWKEGHQRLYEYLKGKAKTFPETIEEMAPLYAAVVHGCLAGRNQETLDVYKKRIQRLDETFSLKKLGAYGSVAAAISAFFVSPWDRLSPGLSEAEQAWVQHEAGFALRGLGRLPEATDLLRLSLESDLAREDWQSAAISACNLSELLQFRGELLEAQTAARESIVLADRDGAPFWCMTNRTVLAAILHALGRQDKAEALFGEAERMQMDHEPACPLLYSLRGYQYCNLLLDQARHVAVLARAAQTLKWVEFHGPLDIALNHVSIGRAHQFAARGSGRIDQNHACQAAKHLQQAVDGLRRANTLHHLPLGLLARAAFLIDTADLPAAHRDLDEALTLSQRCGFRLHECDAHLGFARYHLALRDPAEAAHHLSAASAIIDDTSYHRRDTELADLKAQARLMAEAISRQDRQAGRQERKENDSSAEPSEPSDPLRSSRTLAPLRETPASASTAPSPAPAPTPPPAPSPTMPTNPPVDFLIFAPLEEERDAVLSKLPEPRLLESDGTDSHVYFEAHLPTRRSDRAVYRILVTSPADMGPIHAATTAAHVAERWRPEHVIVVGIAGGLKDEVALGDVMVARSVADYTVGKVHEDGTREERWSMVPADAGLGNYAGAFSTGWEDLISLPRPRGTGTPTRHSGIVASGGDVIANKKLIDTYRKDMPKLIGVEMEGGGVATALHAHMARPRFLMIRGVSDLADAEGNAGTKKQWRAYARDVAAAYTVGMLRAGPVPARRQDASVHAAAPGSSEHLLDALNRLLPAELEVLVFKLALPAAILSASSAPQATRAVEILRWADRAGRLDEVARRLAEVSGK